MSAVGDRSRCLRCGGKIVLIHDPRVISLDRGMWVHEGRAPSQLRRPPGRGAVVRNPEEYGQRILALVEKGLDRGLGEELWRVGNESLVAELEAASDEDIDRVSKMWANRVFALNDTVYVGGPKPDDCTELTCPHHGPANREGQRHADS